MNYSKDFDIIYMSDDWYSFYVTDVCYKYIFKEFFDNNILKDDYVFHMSDKLLEKILGKPAKRKWNKINGR